MGVPPIAGWFMMENPNLTSIIWGYPHFRKPPYMNYPWNKKPGQQVLFFVNISGLRML